MANCKQRLRLWVLKKFLGFYWRREFKNHHSLRFPITFHYFWYNSLHNVTTAMLLNETRNLFNIFLESGKICN